MNHSQPIRQAMTTKAGAVTAIRSLHHFIGPVQFRVIADASMGEERQFFLGKLAEIAATVQTMPMVYEQDGLGDRAVAHLHYFTGSCDWYITERDTSDEQLQAFGLANLGYGAELGYISVAELISAGAELDLYFSPTRLSDLPEAKRCSS